MKKIKYFPLLFLIIALSGCEDYVNIKTQGKLIPNKIINYRYILNYTSNFEMGPRLTDIASDDVALVDSSSQMNALNTDSYMYWLKSYSWQPDVYPIGTYQTDYDWDFMYNTIVTANTVIAEVPDCTDGTEAEKNALIAEALVHRADAYLMLVNKYAKQYNATTANTDLGVPLVLVPTTTQSLKRASVKAVYDQIVADLITAVPSLPLTQQFTTLPSRVSAFGELARTYLCMGEYDKANTYADSALTYKNTLIDLGTITAVSSTTYPLRINDPEILLSKIAYGSTSAYTPYAMRLSNSLMNVLTVTDQRYLLFTTAASTISSSYATAGGRFFYKDRAIGEARNIGPSVPEMMLIKAEYYARKGDVSNAMLWTNKLRIKRFKTANYIALSATDTKDALQKVMDERHREFFCRMLRFWDLKRINIDSTLDHITLTRVLYKTTYTLEPNGNRYVFMLPEYQVKLNPEMEQNPL